MTDLTRRNFLTVAGVTAATFALGLPNISRATIGPFSLAPLPFANDALAPVISQNTLDVHYIRHHQGYINKLNLALALPENSQYARMSLEQIMLTTANRQSTASLFNNAAQALNHQFYWESMMARGGDNAKPTGVLLDKIETAFSSYEAMKTQLVESAAAQFGAGWAWLVETQQGELEILTTSNADNPKIWGMNPLLTIDIWEHAYYLDYQNERKIYVQAVVDNLLNWNIAAVRLAGA